MSTPQAPQTPAAPVHYGMSLESGSYVLAFGPKPAQQQPTKQG